MHLKKKKYLKRFCIYVNISMAALGTRWRHAPSHAPIRGYDKHSFSSMAAAGEDFIDLCLGRLEIFGCEVSFVSGSFLSVPDKVCPTCSQPWRRWISGEGWLQKLVLELWTKGRCVETAPAAVCAKAKTAYLLSIQTTRAVSTHIWTHTENEGRAAKPVSALCCFCCFVTILFSLVWMQYFFALFMKLNRWLKRRRRYEGGAANFIYSLIS